ncbi:cytidylyltransferase domain-containing protein [Intrasporangium calvum]|uniref:Acylneuraminate cytidylyltransferase n=1 Tax=Intrasporangium calvum (strain ATCC 23552 / DSM 43043 / JCM 3097 / NBRC 12989 / NCIMB 10167 / NRRL B-3866 / 7 KIP) TaxID=710696 RepID=E6S8I1_INTC7|nr:glycosyltransferase family protein [Intrasporangium calvum]ADU49143.1 acylneuraminate cytidylyltransferase [Intrasporangium calvum DSM 43043]
MRVVVAIQARMGSTRLPGKVLQDLGGMPVLSWVVRACLAASRPDQVIIATSTSPGDDAIVAAGRNLGVPIVRGSEDDVLARYLQAVDEHSADAVVRITADCPFTDPALIDAVVAAWRADSTLDYVSTFVVRTLPHGLDVEIVSAKALQRVGRRASGHDRVHVTSGIYSAPDQFRVMGLCFAPDATDLRVTIDTPEDLKALRGIVEARGTTPMGREELVSLLRNRPDLVAVNAGVKQKALAEG